MRAAVLRKPAMARGLSYPKTKRRRPPVRIVRLIMPESMLQAQVISLAKLYGWRHYFTHDSRHCPPGFPDLVLVRGVRLIFAELKTQRGRLSADQQAWLEDLRATAAETYVWRPADLPVIAAILRRRS